MSVLTRKTAKLLCARSGIAKTELAEEAQKLVDLCDDPNVPEAHKEAARRQLDTLIHRLKKSVDTSKRLRGEEIQEG